MRPQKTEEQRQIDIYTKLRRAKRRIRKLKAENTRLKAKALPVSPTTLEMVKEREQTRSRETVSPFTKAILIRTANELEDLLKKIA